MPGEGTKTAYKSREVTRASDPFGFYTNLFLTFLKAFFTGHPVYPYKKNAGTSLSITGSKPIQESDAIKTPHLIVVRGPIVFGKSFIDEFVDSDGKGTERYSSQPSFPITIVCVSSNGPEVEYLGSIIANAVQQFKEKITKGSGILDFAEVRMSEIQDASKNVVTGVKASDYKQVMVTVPLTATIWWKSFAGTDTDNLVMASLKDLRIRYNLVEPDADGEDADKKGTSQVAQTLLNNDGNNTIEIINQ